MSRIQIAELENNSELNLLNERETGVVVGGYYGDYGRKLRNDIVSNINIANIVQINNNINIQIAFNGDNFNVANLNNRAGADLG